MDLPLNVDLPFELVFIYLNLIEIGSQILNNFLHLSDLPSWLFLFFHLLFSDRSYLHIQFFYMSVSFVYLDLHIQYYLGNLLEALSSSLEILLLQLLLDETLSCLFVRKVHTECFIPILDLHLLLQLRDLIFTLLNGRHHFIILKFLNFNSIQRSILNKLFSLFEKLFALIKLLS